VRGQSLPESVCATDIRSKLTLDSTKRLMEIIGLEEACRVTHLAQWREACASRSVSLMLVSMCLRQGSVLTMLPGLSLGALVLMLFLL
jgi:hypothetical protein